MQIASHHVIWFGKFKEGRKKSVRLAQENNNKIVVRVVSAARDKEGKMTYVTFDSFDVTEAKPEEVFAAVKEGVLRASAVKK